VPILRPIYPPFTKEKNHSCTNVHCTSVHYFRNYCSNVHCSNVHGGEGSSFAGVRLYLYNKQPLKKNGTHGGLTDHLRQPSCDCPTLRLPFLKVALPLVGQAVWLLPCIYSYEVEAVWLGGLKVGFDCIMGANNVKRLSTNKCVYKGLTVCY